MMSFIRYSFTPYPRQALRCDFRQPRDTLLHVVAEFLSTCSVRWVLKGDGAHLGPELSFNLVLN